MSDSGRSGETPRAAKVRRHRRLTLRVLVEYVSDVGPCCDPATTLGAGGLFLETDSPLRKGTTLKLRFCLPGSDETHDIEGRVAWARRADPTRGHAGGMGIEFIDRVAKTRLARELDALA